MTSAPPRPEFATDNNQPRTMRNERTHLELSTRQSPMETWNMPWFLDSTLQEVRGERRTALEHVQQRELRIPLRSPKNGQDLYGRERLVNVQYGAKNPVPIIQINSKWYIK
ncbi:hypothetical protein AVEN_162823-1 [Araneus ventricosus]|uniref:Uncharacterized protein n=1 Tax=Araneus ventricosus TaxID=182803 RepID=A0A4Y2C5S9_ARAVE|nr:hypothetical protein AVEN_162823-1 [Araneus ventricosus]